MAQGYIQGGSGGSSFDPTGNNKLPMYIDSEGEAKAIDNTGVEISIAGNAATADKLKNKVKITLTGSVTGNVSLDGSEGTKTGVTLATTTAHTHEYAGSDSAGGVANNSKRLNNTQAIGGTTTPVYFNSSGVPIACTAYSSASVSSAVNATNATNINALKSTKTKLFVAGFSSDQDATNQRVRFNSDIQITSDNVLLGAAWNDYAEFRLGNEQPGTCVVESGFGDVIKSSKRLQKCPYVVSDTYGFCIGNQKNSCAVAVSGRVLARTNEKLNVGDVVCSGKDGTVSKMSRLEIILFPDRIIGTVSEIPQYKVWGPQDSSVEVDNRLWITVR